MTQQVPKRHVGSTRPVSDYTTNSSNARVMVSSRRNITMERTATRAIMAINNTDNLPRGPITILLDENGELCKVGGMSYTTTVAYINAIHLMLGVGDITTSNPIFCSFTALTCPQGL